MAKRKAKDIVLPHSQAKLDLYKSYLEKYLPILTLAKGIRKINIYDIFCGIGLYGDGNIGSPLIAVNCIIKNNELFEHRGWQKKPITLNINDGDKGKIENVKELLSDIKIENCQIQYHNLDADQMLNLTIKEINSYDYSERNLIFIDPYGYSHIDKEKILELLKNGYTEIVLFLPAMHMYRFSEVVFTDSERKCYEDLRRFILNFLPNNQSFENVFHFINELTNALTFNDKYFACSHAIEREKGNYYAVFFITSNIYGLERMTEVKWKADPARGKGFNKSQSGGLFGDLLIDYDKKAQLDFLKARLMEKLKAYPNGLSNVDMYILAVKNEFLPTHIVSILKQLKSARRLLTTDKLGNEFSSGNAFYIDYDHYKRNDNKIFYKLN